MIKDSILRLSHLSKSFSQGESIITILRHINLQIYHQEIVAIIGPSGCGKTTLLQLMGLLDKPDKGDVLINGHNYTTSSEKAKTLCRLNNLGFVYQNHNLLSDFTALFNVMMPLLIKGIDYQDAEDSAKDLLMSFGLGPRLHHLPQQLSGGEQQRVAIARSIIHNPDIILADEPTGNLDHHNATKVMDMLISEVRNLGKALVVVTHNLEITKTADKILSINQARLIPYK